MPVQNPALPGRHAHPAMPCPCGAGLCVCEVPPERLRSYARAIVGIHHPVGTVSGYQQCACGTPFCCYLAYARHCLHDRSTTTG